MEKVFTDLFNSFDKNLFEQDGRTFIKKDFEVKCFEAFSNSAYVHNPSNYDIVKPLNDKLLNILLNVIAGGKCGIDIAQMTYNASSDECNVHRTYPAFGYGGAGDIDHECHHTGEGYPGTDFVMEDDFAFVYEDPFTKEVKNGILAKGLQIDGKAYWAMEGNPEKNKPGAKDFLDANPDGSLGHSGNGLLLRIISEHDTWYYCGNRAGFTPVKLINFKPILYYKHVQLSIASDGLLNVVFVD